MVSFLMKPASRRETFPPIGGFRVVADAAGGWKPNFSFALIAAKKYREHGRGASPKEETGDDGEWSHLTISSGRR